MLAMRATAAAAAEEEVENINSATALVAFAREQQSGCCRSKFAREFYRLERIFCIVVAASVLLLLQSLHLQRTPSFSWVRRTRKLLLSCF